METPAPKIEVYRFTRVTFGVAFNPFLLNATIRHHLDTYKEEHSNEVSRLAQSMYVDDIVSGASNKEMALSQYNTYIELLARDGFNLRKFICNKDNTEQQCEQKVLGVLWDVGKDELVVDVSKASRDVNECEHLTKQRVVSIISRIFDPIGIAEPVTIQAKILLQELQKAKVDWDSIIEGDLLVNCKEVLRMLSESQPIHTARWTAGHLNIQNTTYCLCRFGDASSKVYTAVVYLLHIVEGEHKQTLLAFQSRVAPLLSLTIPHLELLSALFLARLIDNISKALSVEVELLPSHCFLDSQVALY